MSTDPSDVTAPAGAARDLFTRRAVTMIAATVILGGGLSFVALPLIGAGGEGVTAFDAICSAIGLSRPKAQASALPGVPASTVAWTPAVLADVARGDVKAGEALAAENCIACHFTNTLSSDPDTVPSTTGMPARALYKQLLDMKNGTRPNDQMQPILEDLKPGQLADLAVYFAQLPRRHHDIRADSGDEAARLVTTGDAARALPACASCHEPALGGPLEAPTLTGQYPAYIAAQLRAYAKGNRKNDVYGRMRTIAAKLSDAEITAISRYYDGWR